jgi:transposase
VSVLVAMWASRRRKRRFRCLECGGRLFRRYNGTRIHKWCWWAIEAGINDG